MGQSRRFDPALSRSNTSLEALCDVSELQWSNLLLDAGSSSLPYLGCSKEVDTAWGLAPCQSEESESELCGSPSALSLCRGKLRQPLVSYETHQILHIERHCDEQHTP